ncbi:tetrapyrrole methylase [Cladochytrium replicatum]|nr:tetrapyrrole methylase [Cladochytrium replicatum]
MSLLVAYQLGGRHVVVVGGGKESSGRVQQAVDAGARVSVVATTHTLPDDVIEYINARKVKHFDRDYVEGDIVPVRKSLSNGSEESNTVPLEREGRTAPEYGWPDPADLVLACLDTDDPALLAVSRSIALICRSNRIPVNCADVPDACDFFFVAQHKVGGRDGKPGIQIGVSTNGCGPRIAVRIRNDIRDKAVDPEAGDALDKIFSLRMKVRAQDPSPAAAARRMVWLSRLCDSWSWKEMSQMNEDQVLMLLDAYEKGDAPPPAAKSRTIKPSAIGSQSTRIITYPFWLLGQFVKAIASGCISVSRFTFRVAYGGISAVAQSAFSHIKWLASSLRPLTSQKSPRLILVGAGPGNPQLLTLRAHRILTQEADVVISDRLVPQPILDLVDARKLQFVPEKSKGKSDVAQAEANRMILDGLKRGMVVARLKGGDPFVFGRGIEEILSVIEAAAGFELGDPEKRKRILLEVVPGLSSSITGPGSAMIPVTHRGAADQFLVLTGRGEKGALPDIPPYHAKRTIVILMGVLRLKELIQMMGDVGYPNELPCAVIERATWTDQRVVRGLLDNIVGKVSELEKPVGSPSLLVFGWVVDALAGVEASL